MLSEIMACESMNGLTSPSKGLVKLEFFSSNDLGLMPGGHEETSKQVVIFPQKIILCPKSSWIRKPSS